MDAGDDIICGVSSANEIEDCADALVTFLIAIGLLCFIWGGDQLETLSFFFS